MKQCPQCNRTYDDSQSFCLMDGTALTIESEQETIVRQKSPVRKKSKFLLWLGLAGLIILAGIGVTVGLLFYSYSKQRESVQNNRQSVVNVQSSPTPPPTLKVTPTPIPATSTPAEQSSPKVEESKPTSDNKDPADITPIDWDTTPSGFKGEDGQTYTFRCPEEGAERLIWGSGIYTLDSSICTAAVHEGLISLAQGGTVTIEFRPGRSTYGSTVRNGIKSKTYGEYPRSFVVR
jgi:hypothetical protein